MNPPQLRSYLYVPGDRPDRLAKSTTRGADAVIADLEDSVTDDAKDMALAHVCDWLATLAPGTVSVWVRVNQGERLEHEVRTLPNSSALVGLLLPKVESAQQVATVHSWVGDSRPGLQLAPMIESAVGVVHVDEIAAAPGVTQLHMGEVDLAADLGADGGHDGLAFLYARSRVVIASRAGGLLPPAAPVSPQLSDMNEYAEGTSLLKRLGFVGRDCIHPAQVRVANDVFTPTAPELAWARRVLAEASRSHGAFRDTDGSMIDEAVLRRARSLVGRDLPADHSR